MNHHDSQIIVLANRQPYNHDRDGHGRLSLRRSPSGVVNAVEPLLIERSGVWIGHGSGDADRDGVCQNDGLAVPPGIDAYRLRRVWLSDSEQREYYDGFANGGLWPLCHRAYVQPVFRSEEFNTYRLVNSRFADAVAEEAIDDRPVVLVQDYHFALAPLMIRQHLPAAAIVTFWHIPWPQWQTFAICPWRHEILQGLLGSSIVGFQTIGDCCNFIETVHRVLGASIDFDEGAIVYQGRRVLVRDYPASIEWPGHWAKSASVPVCRDAVRRDLRLGARCLLGVGVDRLDFTKGIDEKFVIIERLLEMRPDLRGRFVFVQLAEPTRRRLATYRAARLRVFETAERVNRRFSSPGYCPILILEAHHSPANIARYFRAADFCFVNSLHDGMNLVSKEFVAARDDDRGVLLLSEFAGAAMELRDAVLVNPYDAESAAAALSRALDMTTEEQRTRMRRLRAAVASHDATSWATRILDDAIATFGSTPIHARTNGALAQAG